MVNQDLLIIGGTNGSFIKFDIIAQTREIFRRDIARGYKVERYALTSDGGLLLQQNSTGRLLLWDLADGRVVLSGYYLDDELVLYTADGLYASTYEGAQFVRLKFPGEIKLQTLDQFRSLLNRADVINDLVQRKISRSVAPVVPLPPQVQASAQISLTDPGFSLTLKVDAQSTSLLRSVELFIDGRPFHQYQAGGTEFHLEQSITVPAGSRFLTLFARDENDLTSVPRQFAFPASQPTNRLTVIAAGTDHYANARLGRLAYANADARNFHEAVLDSQSSYYVARESGAPPLLDSPNLDSELIESIERYAAASTDDDTLFLLLAGHGLRDEAGQFYFATASTDLENISGTAIGWERIAKAFSAVKGRIIVFVDACHSGAAGFAATNEEATESLLRNQSTPLTIIAASKGRQISLESAAAGGGVFTSSLLRVLSSPGQYDSNGNGSLELAELYRAVKGQVVSETGGRQTPWLARNQMVGEVPLY